MTTTIKNKGGRPMKYPNAMRGSYVMSAADLLLIKQAAKAKGQTFNEFLRIAAVSAARSVEIQPKQTDAIA